MKSRHATCLITLSKRLPPPPSSTLFPYTTLFRSEGERREAAASRASKRKAPEKEQSSSDETAKEPARATAGSAARDTPARRADRKSTRLNSSHQIISYAVFCLKKKKNLGPTRRIR